MATVAAPFEFDLVTDPHDAIVARADRVRFLDLGERHDFAVDGSGPPGDPAFQAAFRVLYPVAYTLHFALKRRGIGAPVGALEGLYWFDGVETITPTSFAPAGSDPDPLALEPSPAGAHRGRPRRHRGRPRRGVAARRTRRRSTPCPS